MFEADLQDASFLKVLCWDGAKVLRKSQVFGFFSQILNHRDPNTRSRPLNQKNGTHMAIRILRCALQLQDIGATWKP